MRERTCSISGVWISLLFALRRVVEIRSATLKMHIAIREFFHFDMVYL